jgi:transposase-like protein
LIDENVLPGTTVMTDCWKSYNGLTAKGFQHLTVNHSSHFVDPETWANTQKIESSWRALKKRMSRWGIERNFG